VFAAVLSRSQFLLCPRRAQACWVPCQMVHRFPDLPDHACVDAL
jgi:hypothetical protein